MLDMTLEALDREILNVFLWLIPTSRDVFPTGPEALWADGLNLNEIEHFSKVSGYLKKYVF